MQSVNCPHKQKTARQQPLSRRMVVMKRTKVYTKVVNTFVLVAGILMPSAYASPGSAPVAANAATVEATAANARTHHTALTAASPAPIAPIAEPYEPGSSTVVNDWHFTPGEKTTIANNLRSHHHHSGTKARTPHHHHSST
jgi:hypothetical protein